MNTNDGVWVSFAHANYYANTCTFSGLRKSDIHAYLNIVQKKRTNGTHMWKQFILPAKTSISCVVCVFMFTYATVVVIVAGAPCRTTPCHRQPPKTMSCTQHTRHAVLFMAPPLFIYITLRTFWKQIRVPNSSFIALCKSAFDTVRAISKDARSHNRQKKVDFRNDKTITNQILIEKPTKKTGKV